MAAHSGSGLPISAARRGGLGVIGSCRRSRAWLGALWLHCRLVSHLQTGRGIRRSAVGAGRGAAMPAQQGVQEGKKCSERKFTIRSAQRGSRETRSPRPCSVWSWERLQFSSSWRSRSRERPRASPAGPARRPPMRPSRPARTRSETTSGPRSACATTCPMTRPAASASRTPRWSERKPSKSAGSSGARAWICARHLEKIATTPSSIPVSSTATSAISRARIRTGRSRSATRGYTRTVTRRSQRKSEPRRSLSRASPASW
jgi:hypothetical protein